MFASRFCPQEEAIYSAPIAVSAGCHARIELDTDAPAGGELAIAHFRAKDLLARESRPLTFGQRTAEIKTHPEASHIACALLTNGQPISGVTFTVHCGRRIQAAARHFIVIGAMKAGTTTLFELLAQHPALCRTWSETPGLSFPKEINYFHSLYRPGDTALHYDWRFPFDPARHAWTLDVSPNYAKWPASREVPERIASLGGQTKLAYILREPVDRIESHAAHMLRSGREMTNMQHCIRTSRYAMQLDKFMAHIERENILLLDFSQLQRNPVKILTQVCDFLGIERFVAHSVVHNRRGVRFRLGAKQRAELARSLRSDVDRLISVYGFTPAKKWLRRRPQWWLRPSAYLR